MYFRGQDFIAKTIATVAQGELLEDPNDRFAQFFFQLTSNLSLDATTFAMFYLVIHGIINTIFVVGLLRGQQWAYGFALIAMSTFMVYQIYRLTISFSPWLFVLTIFDLAVIYLIWHEYRYTYGKR